MRVYVLLFNARTENEGIHTISITDPEDGEARNVVLMFESEEDATRFGIMLEAQDFPTATVEAFDEEEIAEFCESADYDYKVIPEGTLALPPETNVEATDWKEDAEQSPLGGNRHPSGNENNASGDFSASELDQIRRRLEGLL